MDINLTLAFIAGLASFLSPCVLPLVPAYLSYMGGRATQQAASRRQFDAVALPVGIGARLRMLSHGAAFVAGFAFVFVVLGLVTTAFIREVGGANVALAKDVIARVGGSLIIVFGLHFAGMLRSLLDQLETRGLTHSMGFTIAFSVLLLLWIGWALPDAVLQLPAIAIAAMWLILGGAFTQPATFWDAAFARLRAIVYADTRRQIAAPDGNGLASSSLMGVVFAAGWTPCIGPIYGSILTLAANGGDIGTAGGLLLAYSIGLGVPFLVTALLFDGASALLARVRRYLHAIELATGTLLVVVGVLVASGQLQQLSQTFANQFADFSYRLEECAVSVARGEQSLGAFDTCMNDVDSAPADPAALTTLPPA